MYEPEVVIAADVHTLDCRVARFDTPLPGYTHWTLIDPLNVPDIVISPSATPDMDSETTEPDDDIVPFTTMSEFGAEVEVTDPVTDIGAVSFEFMEVSWVISDDWLVAVATPAVFVTILANDEFAVAWFDDVAAPVGSALDVTATFGVPEIEAVTASVPELRFHVLPVVHVPPWFAVTVPEDTITDPIEATPGSRATDHDPLWLTA